MGFRTTWMSFWFRGATAAGVAHQHHFLTVVRRNQKDIHVVRKPMGESVQGYRHAAHRCDYTLQADDGWIWNRCAGTGNGRVPNVDALRVVQQGIDNRHCEHKRARALLTAAVRRRE